MANLYLIAHRVRNEPAFDVAEQITCTVCQGAPLTFLPLSASSFSAHVMCLASPSSALLAHGEGAPTASAPNFDLAASASCSSWSNARAS